MIEKSPEAFRTISEVAEELDLPQHVLRFWETRFAQIKPMKRGGGRRYYRPEDVNLLKGIRFLLYSEGYTIKGVQRILKEQGVRHVATIWETGEFEAEDAPVPTHGSAGQIAPSVSDSPMHRAPEPPVYDPPGSEPVSMEPRVAAPAGAAGQQAAPRDLQAMPTPHARVSQEGVRQLKAALLELIECKRLLDSATQGSGT